MDRTVETKKTTGLHHIIAHTPRISWHQVSLKDVVKVKTEEMECLKVCLRSNLIFRHSLPLHAARQLPLLSPSKRLEVYLLKKVKQSL